MLSSLLQLRLINKWLSALFIFSVVLGPFAQTVRGQSYSTSTGMPSFSAPDPVELGFVDAATGNLHLSIPLGSYTQRGSSQPETITLQYDSNIWNVTYGGGTTLFWAPNNGPAIWSKGGWSLSYLIDQSSTPLAQVQNCTTDNSWMDRNGTVHVFHLNTANKSGCAAQADGYATDSSGYHMYYTNSYPTFSEKVYGPDGTLVYSFPDETDANGNYIVTKDSNGNYMSTPQNPPYYVLTDTVGRQIAAYNGSLQNSTVTVSTSQGVAQYQLAFTTISVQTNFQQSNVKESYSGATISVLKSITLPDAAKSTYTFTYDCDQGTGNQACTSPSGQSAYYGVLTGITMPTGGEIGYTYQTFTDAYQNKNRWVASRTSSDGTRYYSPQVLTTCSATQVNCKQQTTVSSLTNQTVYTFQLNNGAWPITVAQKDSSGNVLSTVTNTWDFSQPCVTIGCHGNAFIRLLSQQTTVPSSNGNLTKQTTYTYDSPQYGNKTAVKEWKYVPSSSSFSSVPDRTTYTSYHYTGTNNINRPSSVTLCSNVGSDSACPGGGSRVSQTLYTYDAYGTSGLSTIVGVAQHDDQSYGSNYTARGNVTAISRWVSGSSYISTSYTYDTTGQVLSATDQGGDVTGYSYVDNYATDNGNDTTPASYSPARPTNAYPTTVTDRIGSRSMAYYLGSGKTAITTDYNGVSIYNHFADGLDRQTEEAPNPAQQTTTNPIGWILASYPSLTESDAFTAVGDTSPSENCTSCQHTETILDSWGRTESQVLVNGPLGSVSVDSTYDQAGRLQEQSHPYAGTGDPNHVFEVFTYDAMDRPTSTRHPDGQSTQVGYGAKVTGLGGITNQIGSATTYGYGYPQVAMDETSRQRQQWLDGFGNIIEVDEPSVNAATLGTGSITIYTGTYQQGCVTNGPCFWAYDYGTVSITVSGQTFTASYNQYSSGASTLASELNSSGLVTAVLNGNTIAVTGTVPGANAQMSGSCTSLFQQNGVTTHFVCPQPAVSGISGGTGGLASSPFATSYMYDAAGRLTKVVQGVQTRTFSYDGLGRKISETTPEAGTVSYSYNTVSGGLCSSDPSQVCSRTDARGVISTYTYYAGRLTGVSYTVPSGKSIAPMPNVCTTAPGGTPANVCYYYDQGGASAYAIGQLTQMTDTTGSETYSHDASGRITGLSKVINGVTYSTSYQYDAGGDVTQITYPSGRVIQQAYNVIGQLCEIAPTVSGCSGSTAFATGFSYNAPGNLLGFTYGNGVSAEFNYSPTRSQLTSLSYKKGSSNYFSLQYSYQQSSPYSPSCPTGTATNNGAIECITDVVVPSRNVNYTYDSLGRMIAEKTAGSSPFAQWGLAQAYDRFGNRLSQTVTAGSGLSSNLTFGTNGVNSTTTNQPNGYTFDSSGNMTVEPLVPQQNYMTYDGENRMTAVSGGGGGGTYTYDGNGLRVVKSIAGGSTTVSIYSGNSVIAEYDNGAAPSAPSREYIYNGAGATTGLLAMISGSSTTYYHQDHLSVRLTTDANGSIVTQEGHYPFGESWYQSGTGNKLLFTSYQRDSESGLDYALARYYDSRTGTFCSADPLAGDPSDPQSWNRYPYGRNDPIDVTDPSGKSWWSSLLIDVGIGVAMYFAGPEIASWLGLGGTTGSGAAAAQAHITADLASGAAIPSSTPGLFYRGAVSAINAGADAGAGVSANLSLGLAGTAAALKATDQSKQNQRPSNATIIKDSLSQKRLRPCSKAVFGNANALTAANAPKIQYLSPSQISEQLGGWLGSKDAAGTNNPGTNTAYFNSSVFTGKLQSIYYQSNYLHEAGNIISQKLFGNQLARGNMFPDPKEYPVDQDSGASFERCIFGHRMQIP